MKRFISFLMTFIIIISSAFVANAKGEVVDVTLSMYCNFYDADVVAGKYKDNSFYVSIETLCKLSRATVSLQDKEKVCLSLNNNVRNCSIFLKDQVMNDHLCEEKDIAMPCFEEYGTIYISALHFLRYFGATVVLEKNNSPQLTIYFPYNQMDVLADLEDTDLGNFFQWSEVDNGKDTNTTLLFAGLTAFINQDSNFFRWAIDPRGIEREMLEEVLTVIVKNEGQAAFTEDDPLLEEMNFTNDLGGIVEGAVDALKEVGAIEIPQSFLDSWEEDIPEVSYLLNVLNAVDTMRQYENVSDSQKDLLQNTILSYKEDSPMLCGDWENIYKASKNVDSRIQNDFTNTFEAGREAAEKSAYTLLDAATGNPVSLAWSCLIFSGKTILSENVNKKTQLYNAYNCSMIQNVANELLVKAAQDLTNNNHYHFNLSNQTYAYTKFKNSLILQLKSTITTRQYLIESQSLTRTYKEDMEEMIRETAVLLNKVENCKIIPIGIDPEANEDLSWLANYKETVEIECTEEDLNKLKELIGEISKMGYLDGYVSSDPNAYADILSSILHSNGVADIYSIYFDGGFELKYSSGRNFSESPKSERDPLDEFGNSYCYIIINATNVDWLIKNIFNVEPKAEEKIIYDKYNKIYKLNGNYYFTCGDGFNECYSEEVNISKNTNGTYTVTYNSVFWGDDPENAERFEATCMLKSIEGKKQWTFTSIKQIEKDATVHDTSMISFLGKSLSEIYNQFGNNATLVGSSFWIPDSGGNHITIYYPDNSVPYSFLIEREPGASVSEVDESEQIIEVSIHPRGLSEAIIISSDSNSYIYSDTPFSVLQNITNGMLHDNIDIEGYFTYFYKTNKNQYVIFTYNERPTDSAIASEIIVSSDVRNEMFL